MSVAEFEGFSLRIIGWDGTPKSFHLNYIHLFSIYSGVYELSIIQTNKSYEKHLKTLCEERRNKDVNKTNGSKLHVFVPWTPFPIISSLHHKFTIFDVESTDAPNYPKMYHICIDLIFS